MPSYRRSPGSYLFVTASLLKNDSNCGLRAEGLTLESWASETQSDAQTVAAEVLPPALPPPPVLPPPPTMPEGVIASNGNGSLTFGNYTYDPAGAITAIGGDTYRYDKVGRLVSGTALGGTKTQTFTYDTYGNLTSITKGTVTSPLSVDAATNHISSPATRKE
ncbi:MAG: hypothetical protein ABI718_17550 [Acidobacteriota bacterium]